MAADEMLKVRIPADEKARLEAAVGPRGMSKLVRRLLADELDRREKESATAA